MGIGIPIRFTPLGLSILLLAALVRPVSAAPMVTFSAELLATSGCDLQAASETLPCVEMVLPIEARLSFKSVSRGRRIKKSASSDSDGHLVASLPKGTYTIRLQRVATSGAPLPAKDLRVSPGRVRVKRSAAPTLLLVTHKTRTAPGVSIGYNK